MIITVINHKGGVGKTTTALNLAEFLPAYGLTLLVDADPQESLKDTLNLRESEKLFSFLNLGNQADKEIINELKQHQDKDFIIVDCSPGATDKNDFWLKVSDLILIPLAPDGFSLLGLLKLIKKAKELNPDARRVCFLNGYNRRLNLHNESKVLLSDFREFIPVAVRHSVKISEAITTGQGIIKQDPNHPAAKDFEILFKLILDL